MIARQSLDTEVSKALPSGGFTQLAPGIGGGQVQLLGLSGGTPYLSGMQLDTGAWSVLNTSLADKCPAQAYTTLVTGTAPNNDLEVLGLDPNGWLSLACWRDKQGNWNPGASFENVDSQPYSSLVAGVGKNGSLQVVALGTNGLPYLACRIEPNLGWQPGFRLPSADSSVRYSALVTTPGPGNSLLVMGLDTEGRPLLACSQDSTGNWNAGHALPIPSGLTFGALATGNSRNNSVEVVGLLNGLPYLACRLDSQSGWQSGQPLPNVASQQPEQPQQYTALVTGQGSDNSLLVVGLGTDGLPYLPCYQNKAGNWNAGQPLPNVDTRQYKALFTSPGADQSLLVLGLGKDDNQPYLVCYQDKAGGWHSGLPLARPTTWIIINPAQFVPRDTRAFPSETVAFLVSPLRGRTTKVTATPSPFEDGAREFYAPPGEIVRKTLSSTPFEKAILLTDTAEKEGTSAGETSNDGSGEAGIALQTPGRDTAFDTMRGSINVVLTDEED